MTHPDQLTYVGLVKAAMPEYFRDSRVLEVGSLDLNGSVREHFVDCEYIGLDVGPGIGVDVVCPGENYDAPSDSFDVVISCECMEHNPEWRATCMNMVRMLKPGGLFLLSCASPGRPEHGTSRSTPEDSPLTLERGQDYYQNLGSDDFRSVRALFESMSVSADWNNWAASDFYLLGVKAGASTPNGWSDAVDSVGSWVEARSSSLPALWARKLLLRAAGDRGLQAMKRGASRIRARKAATKP